MLKTIHIIGFGNTLRGDDRLGFEFVKKLHKENLEGIRIGFSGQLVPEIVLDFSEHDTVIFIDASVSGKEPYTFKKVVPCFKKEFSSGLFSPEMIAAIAMGPFNVTISVYLLAIRGYDFNVAEKMTQKAEDNLDSAVAFLRQYIEII